ncbi:hypothetical protein VRK_07300 [Vibrio sp. MEBiC08052]|nr:hypothetical protein VRK_07300 [Vibrio sp. MEBiC08052]
MVETELAIMCIAKVLGFKIPNKKLVKDKKQLIFATSALISPND